MVAQTGAALVESDVDVVCFTGSFATGRRVATAAAERLARVQLELGGKDPAYVCDDVDIAATAAAVAEGVFYNAGQSCCAIERVYVHAAVFDDFVDAFVAEASAYVPGDPTDDDTRLGPLARWSSLRCSPRRWPTQRGGVPASRSKVVPSTGRATSSRRSCSSTSTTR